MGELGKKVISQPGVVAGVEDAALTKIVATSGLVFITVPTVVASESIERYGFVSIGKAKDIEARFHAITAVRRFTHPAILAMTRSLRSARR